jgi:hypothetical protein
MIQKTETPKNASNLLRSRTLAALGTAALAIPGAAAQPAAAQTGGVEAPAPVTAAMPSGGAEGPVDTTQAEADQTLNLQAQQDSSTLAEGVLKLSATNPTSELPMRGVQGELLNTTVTVPAKDAQGHKDGNYTFNVISGEGPDGQLQTDEVYSITASENPKPSKNGQPKPPIASVMIDQNPANGMAEASGTYEVFPSKSATASNKAKYVPISAGIEPVAPNALRLTAPDEAATATQIKGLEQSAAQGDPLHREEQAFDAQGNTINDPAN